MQHHPADLGCVAALGAARLRGDFGRLRDSQAHALGKVVPDEFMCRTIAGRPELADYTAKLMWVRSHMEHARGATEAQYIGGALATRPHKYNVVDMGVVTVDRRTPGSPLLGCLQEECAKCVHSGDWGGIGTIAGTIVALTKGEDKGKGAFGNGPSWGRRSYSRRFIPER